MLNPIRSIMTKVSEKRARHKAEKAQKKATKPARKELFAANGWGPNSMFEGRNKPYRGPLYPAPDYAAFAINKARPAYSDDAQKMCNEARKYWSQGLPLEAEKHYRKAQRRAPDNAEFYFENAQLFWGQGRLFEAKELVEKALALKPDFVSARVSHMRLTQRLEGTVSESDWKAFLDAEDNRDTATHDAVAALAPEVANTVS